MMILNTWLVTNGGHVATIHILYIWFLIQRCENLVASPGMWSFIHPYNIEIGHFADIQVLDYWLDILENALFCLCSRPLRIDIFWHIKQLVHRFFLLLVGFRYDELGLLFQAASHQSTINMRHPPACTEILAGPRLVRCGLNICFHVSYLFQFERVFSS